MCSRDTPRIASIKRFVDDLDLETGEPVFLVFADDGSFDVERALPETGNPLVDAVRWTGRHENAAPDPHGDPEQAEAVIRTVAAAGGLGQTLSPGEVVSAYAGRGDTGLARILRHIGT